MPQHSQDFEQSAQSNQHFLRLMKGGSPGRGSGTDRSVVVPLQRGQAGGIGIMHIPLIHWGACHLAVSYYGTRTCHAQSRCAIGRINAGRVLEMERTSMCATCAFYDVEP